MSTINLQDFTRDPDAVLTRLQNGEWFLMICDGQPVAELRPVVSASAAPRPFGLAAGEFAVPVDFDEPLPDEIVREFEVQ